MRRSTDLGFTSPEVWQMLDQEHRANLIYPALSHRVIEMICEGDELQIHDAIDDSLTEFQRMIEALPEDNWTQNVMNTREGVLAYTSLVLLHKMPDEHTMREFAYRWAKIDSIHQVRELIQKETPQNNRI